MPKVIPDTTLFAAKRAKEIEKPPVEMIEVPKADYERLGVLEDTITRRRDKRATIQQEVDSENVDAFPTDVSEE